MKKRKAFLDTIKGFCAIWIFLGHFTAAYAPEIDAKLSFLFPGLSGKLCLAMFLAISGYLHAQNKKEDDFDRIIRRYFRFVIPLLIVNVLTGIIYVAYNLLLQGKLLNLWELLQEIVLESFTLPPACALIPHAWCMGDFFIAYLLGAFYKHTAHPDRNGILIAVILLLSGKYWILAYLLGMLIGRKEELLHDRILASPILRIVLFAGIAFLIRRNEVWHKYLLDSLGASILFALILSSDPIRKYMDIPGIRKTGLYSYEILITQYIICETLMNVLLRFSNGLPVLLAGFAVCLVLTLFCSWLLQKLCSILLKKIETLV